jgi:hypothetical protein
MDVLVVDVGGHMSNLAARHSDKQEFASGPNDGEQMVSGSTR